MNTTTEIKLQYPITTKDGNKLECLCMRRLKVRDLEMAEMQSDGSETTKVILLAAASSQQMPDDIRELDAADMAAISGAVVDFLG